MTTPHIELLDIDEAKAAAAAAGVLPSMAELSVFRMLLRHPKLAKSLQEASTSGRSTGGSPPSSASPTQTSWPCGTGRRPTSAAATVTTTAGHGPAQS